MKSKIHTLKRNSNTVTTQSNNRRKPKLTKAESRKMENTSSEKLTDSITMKLRELEHEYIKEFEKNMHSEENGKVFNEAELEQIGQGIDKLETVLGNIKREEEDCMIENEQNSDCVNNDKNHTIDKNICINKDKIKAKYMTKFPLPIKTVTKARKRLNLTSYEGD